MRRSHTPHAGTRKAGGGLVATAALILLTQAVPAAEPPATGGGLSVVQPTAASGAGLTGSDGALRVASLIGQPIGGAMGCSHLSVDAALRAAAPKTPSPVPNPTDPSTHPTPPTTNDQPPPMPDDTSNAPPLDTTSPQLTITTPSDGLLLGPAREDGQPLASPSSLAPRSPAIPTGVAEVSDVGQHGFTAAGGVVGADHRISVMTIVGEPIGGGAGAVGAGARIGPMVGRRKSPRGTRIIAVEGTVDDPEASVVVNGIKARVADGAYRAEGILLTEGLNPITVTATDAAGNQSRITVTVRLDTCPPARPTLNVSAVLPAAAPHRLLGTTVSETSVWLSVDGGDWIEIAPMGGAEDWTASLPALTEGEHTLTVMAKDAAGNVSTVGMTTVTVDELPPVVTLAPPAKTNLTPLALHGTVDDHLTGVTINGLTASRAARAFDLTLPLSAGLNTLRLVAVSPNGHVTRADYSVTLGTIPVIRALLPGDGALVYAGSAVTIQVDAMDQERDPIAYDVQVDGTRLEALESLDVHSWTWTPGLEALGAHTLKAVVQDAFGGERVQDAEVFVVRKPIEAP